MQVKPLVLDTTSPTISLKWNKENAIFRGGESIIFTTTLDESTSTPPLFSMSGIVTSTAMSATNSETRWTYDLIVPSGLNSSALVTIVAEDKAGNASSYTSTNSFEIDSEVPRFNSN